MRHMAAGTRSVKPVLFPAAHWLDAGELQSRAETQESGAGRQGARLELAPEEGGQDSAEGGREGWAHDSAMCLLFQEELNPND